MRATVFSLALLLTACAWSPLSERAAQRAGLSSLVKVLVLYAEDDGPAVYAGSGSVVGHDHMGHQLVLTAKHLLTVGGVTKSIMCRASEDLPAGVEQEAVDAEIAATADDADLALLRLAKGSLARAALRLGPRPRQGDEVWYFGDPHAFPTIFGRGTLTRLHFRDEQEPDDTYEYVGAAWSGMSGGPLLDASGRLIGVLAMMARGTNPETDEPVAVPIVGYAVGRDTVARFLKKSKVLP